MLPDDGIGDFVGELMDADLRFLEPFDETELASNNAIVDWEGHRSTKGHRFCLVDSEVHTNEFFIIAGEKAFLRERWMAPDNFA